MDDLSQLLGGLSGSSGGAASLEGLARSVRAEGGLDDLMGKLRDAGMGDAVDSWVGTGPNQPLDPQALGAAIGNDEAQRLSAGSGLDLGTLLPLLAAFLPQVINMLTPQGQVPDGGLNQAAQTAMPDLGSILGGLGGNPG